MAKPLYSCYHPILLGAKSSQSLPGFINKAATVGEKGTVDRVENRKFSQSLHGKQQHETDNHEPDQLKSTISTVDVGIALLILTTEPGPPLLKAPPVPTNRPAPIEPPELSPLAGLLHNHGLDEGLWWVWYLPIAIICIWRPLSSRARPPDAGGGVSKSASRLPLLS